MNVEKKVNKRKIYIKETTELVLIEKFVKTIMYVDDRATNSYKP